MRKAHKGRRKGEGIKTVLGWLIYMLQAHFCNLDADNDDDANCELTHMKKNIISQLSYYYVHNYTLYELAHCIRLG